MKQKKKFLYIILPIVLLCIVAFGYKFYCCDTVTDYLQVTYYPRMVKLYSVNWGYGREYDDPEVKVSIKKYENDSIAFSTEYGMEKAYCLCLDLTADSTGNEPPIQMFTLKGGDFITNKYPGVGGLDGLSSGIVSSPVAASKLINWGYSGVGVFNPYRSFILREL